MASFIRNLSTIFGRTTKIYPGLDGFSQGRQLDSLIRPADFFLDLRSISTTAPLCAEPLKKKKKLDPAVIRAREERKRRKLEKQIRRLERNQGQLKPLDENEIPLCLVEEPKVRERKLPQLPTEIVNARWKLVKEWGLCKASQVEAEIIFFQKIRKSQEKALEELRKESESMYEAAIKIDPNLLPYTAKAPTDTPPIENYASPDGDYIDVSKKWE